MYISNEHLYKFNLKLILYILKVYSLISYYKQHSYPKIKPIYMALFMFWNIIELYFVYV